jgi:hypothetical protein
VFGLTGSSGSGQPGERPFIQTLRQALKCSDLIVFNVRATWRVREHQTNNTEMSQQQHGQAVDDEHRNIVPQPQTEEGGINWLYMTPLLGAPLLPLGTPQPPSLRPPFSKSLAILNSNLLIRFFFKSDLFFVKIALFCG